MNVRACQLTDTRNFLKSRAYAAPAVHSLSVGTRASALPEQWDTAISAWTIWLRVAGKREGTIRLRRDHVRSIARRSKTNNPGEVTLNRLVTLCSERGWSREHRKGVRASLISFYEWAVLNNVAEANPALLLPTVSPPLPRPRPAPDDVWYELLASAKPRERLMARLAGEAGLRRAEVAACHSDDLLHDGEGWALLIHGKGGRQRVVPLMPDLAAEIRDHCTNRGYLFPGQVDGHISPGWVGTIVSELMPQGWTMHKLRHRFASLGYAGTRDIVAVKEVLGHASVATTQRYVATSMREVRSVTEAASGKRPPLP